MTIDSYTSCAIKSIMLSVLAFGITALSITALSITVFSIKSAALGINDTLD